MCIVLWASSIPPSSQFICHVAFTRVTVPNNVRQLNQSEAEKLGQGTTISSIPYAEASRDYVCKSLANENAVVYRQGAMRWRVQYHMTTFACALDSVTPSNTRCR